MNILVLNGSPKGDQSITLQHIKFLAQKNPDHQLEVVNIGNKIRKIETTKEYFEELLLRLKSCDVLIWSFPVYYALVPSQLKRFIELLCEKASPDDFKNKFATSFSTSIHFFDHTAHNYMQAISEDLGFTYIKGYSAHMDDFFHEDQRQKMLGFYRWFLEMALQNVAVSPKYQTVSRHFVEFVPQPMEPVSKIRKSPRILLLTDAEEPDIIIMAGTIKDHYLSATWKQFLDRSFFNGHAPVLKGKRLGFMISGPLRQIQNLRETLEAIADNWHMKSYPVVTDEADTSGRITPFIKNMAFTGIFPSDKFKKEFEMRFFPFFFPSNLLEKPFTKNSYPVWWHRIRSGLKNWT